MNNRENSTGAGLGLNISNKLALGLGGNRGLEVESDINLGTKFTFYVLNREKKKGLKYGYPNW